MGALATDTTTPPRRSAAARGRRTDHVEAPGEGTSTTTRVITPAPEVARGTPRLTASPDTSVQRFLNSAAAWLALVAYWALADALLTSHPPGGREYAPEGWAALSGCAVLGLVGAWCAQRTGFPAAWDARLPATRRLLLPALVGGASGALAIALEEVTHSLRILQGLLGPATFGFPGSLLAYSAGAIKFELLFLLFPVPLLLWLVSGVALRGRGQTGTFWVLAALSAALEPALALVTLPPVSGGAVGPAAFAALAGNAYAANLAAAVGFRRYGLLAAILVRMGNYLVWHVAYGNFLFD